MGLWLRLPGRMTFRHLSRESGSHETTLARGLARDVDFVSRHRAAIAPVMPPHPEQALAFDPRCVSKRGQQTSGLGKFWQGAHSRTDKGVAITGRAWREGTSHSAETLSGAHTAPTLEHDAEQTRIAASLAPLTQVGTTQPFQALSSLVVDGYFRKKQCGEGLGALALPLMGKRRHDAKLRSFSTGPRRRGRGRPRRDDGKGKLAD